jgi:hypothetical protein
LRGQAYQIKTPSQATDDELRKAIAHNKQLAVIQPDELKLYNQKASEEI